MTYILIFVWHTQLLSVEFNNLPACRAAVDEIRKQAVLDRTRLPLLVCAGKGTPQPGSGAK